MGDGALCALLLFVLCVGIAIGMIVMSWALHADDERAIQEWREATQAMRRCTR